MKVNHPFMFLTSIDGTLPNKTKLFVRQLRVSKSLRRKSNKRHWENLNKTELNKILSLYIAIGNVQMPKVTFYWSKPENYYHE